MLGMVLPWIHPLWCSVVALVGQGISHIHLHCEMLWIFPRVAFPVSTPHTTKNQIYVNRATITERITFQSFRISSSQSLSQWPEDISVRIPPPIPGSSVAGPIVAECPVAVQYTVRQQIEIWSLICVGLIYRPHRDE